MHYAKVIRSLISGIESRAPVRSRAPLLRHLQQLLEHPESAARGLDDLEAHCRAQRQSGLLQGLLRSHELEDWAGAIYQHTVLGASRKSVPTRVADNLSAQFLLNRLNQPASTWKVLDALAEATAVDLGTFSRQVADEDVLPSWAANAHRLTEDVRVIIQRDAAENMLMSAMETYRVRPRGKKKVYTEMFGLCIGHTTSDKQMPIFVNVERFVPQLRANADHESVEPNTQSTEEHLRLVRQLMPEKLVVGTMHTHPYDDFQELVAQNGWEFSPQDSASTSQTYGEWVGRGHRPEVEIIVAVAQKLKARMHSNQQRFGLNTRSFTIAGCEVVFAAYRVRRDGSVGAGPIHLELRFSASPSGR
ncbi:MAG: hypothetical protein JST92_19930 [Deltaproteobacteria bacterium]|nr:hypothetical protein [Deltaproteobacteria bacterium]